MKRLSDPRGAAVVEFAIVLPLLLMMLFGTIEWGYYFFTREIVINSAREGARSGSLLGATSSDATDATKLYLTNAGLPLMRNGSPVATVEFVSAAGGTCPTGSSCIRVKYDVPSLTGFLDAILGPTRTIVAYAQMRK